MELAKTEETKVESSQMVVKYSPLVWNDYMAIVP